MQVRLSALTIINIGSLTIKKAYKRVIIEVYVQSIQLASEKFLGLDFVLSKQITCGK